MTDRSFERANDQSRERLARLIATLTPARLAVDLGGGWTVAAALAHAGFWDR
jgi:L-alanine-DL-glutamate epimerase-like enolase superfamily enzyme